MIREFMGRKIELDDKLVEDFKRIMNEDITDRLIRIYIKAYKHEKVTEKLVSSLSDKELSMIIRKGMLSELNLSGEYKDEV